MNKIIGIVCVATLIVGIGWLNRIDMLLMVVKFQSDREFEIEPARELAWQQGRETPASDQRPPNIVFILADDMGYNDISTFGGGIADGKVKTPNIDQLAADGAVFEQSYAGNATCAPSRAMLMTGRYPTRTGFEFTPTPSGFGPMVAMIGNSLDNGLPPYKFNDELAETGLPYEGQGLLPSEVTVAEVLREKGYYTAHIGKWHLGQGEGQAPNDQGFDDSPADV